MNRIFFGSAVCFLLSNLAFAITFDEAVQTISRDSESERLDKATSDKAKAHAQAAWQIFLPRVSAVGSESRIGSDSKDSQSDGVRSQEARLDFDLNLFRFGADAARSEAGRMLGRLADQKLILQTSAREYQAATLLIHLIYAIKLRAAETSFLAIKDKSAKLTDTLYQRGLKSAQDLAAMQVELAQQKSAVTKSELEIDAALSAVKALSSRTIEIDASWPEPWPWQNLLTTPSHPLLTASQAPSPSKVNLRTQLAQQEALAAKAEYELVRSQGLPSLDFNHKLLWLKSDDVPDVGRTWQSTISLSVPLYERGLGAVDRATAYEKLITAENHVSETSRQSHIARELARQKLLKLVQQLNLQRQTSAQAKQIYDSSLSGYQRGVTRVNDLSTDQLRYLNSEKLALELMHDLHLTLVDLCREEELSLKDCIR